MVSDEVKDLKKELQESDKQNAIQRQLIKDLQKSIKDGKFNDSEIAKNFKALSDYRNALFLDPQKLGQTEDSANALRDSLLPLSNMLQKVHGNAEATSANLFALNREHGKWIENLKHGSEEIKKRNEQLKEELVVAKEKSKWWGVERALDESLTKVIERQGELAGKSTVGFRGRLIESLNDKVLDPIVNSPITKIFGLGGFGNFAQMALINMGTSWLKGARKRKYEKQGFEIRNHHFKNLSRQQMGGRLERTQQKFLQNQIEKTRDKDDKIDTDHWAFRTLSEMFEKTGMRAELQIDSQEIFEDILEKSFNKNYSEIDTDLTRLLSSRLSSQESTKEGLEKESTEILKPYEEAVANLEKIYEEKKIEMDNLPSSHGWDLGDSDKESQALEQEHLKALDDLKNITFKDSLDRAREIDQQLTNDDKILLELQKLENTFRDNKDTLLRLNHNDIKTLGVMLGREESDKLFTDISTKNQAELSDVLYKLFTGSPTAGESLHTIAEYMKEQVVNQKKKIKMAKRQGRMDEAWSADKEPKSTGILGDILKPLAGGLMGLLGSMGGLGGATAGTGIAAFLTSIGAGIAGMLGAIAALTPAGVAIGLAGLTGVTSQFLILGAALKIAAEPIKTILGSVVKAFQDMTEVKWSSIGKAVAAIAGLGLSLQVFGATSLLAVPALLATGYMFEKLTGLVSSLPDSQKLTDLGSGFKDLAEGVGEFGLKSLSLIPTLPLFALLDKIPLVNKLVDLQKESVKLNTNTNITPSLKTTQQVDSQGNNGNNFINAPTNNNVTNNTTQTAPLQVVDLFYRDSVSKVTASYV